MIFHFQHAVPIICELIVLPHRSNPDTATEITSSNSSGTSYSPHLTNSSPWELANITTMICMLTSSMQQQQQPQLENAHYTPVWQLFPIIMFYNAYITVSCKNNSHATCISYIHHNHIATKRCYNVNIMDTCSHTKHTTTTQWIHAHTPSILNKSMHN